MRIHLVKEKMLRYYAIMNAQSAKPIQQWLTAIKTARWFKPADILEDFATADLLGRGSSRVVFDLGGNKYRMICQYAFGKNTWVHMLHIVSFAGRINNSQLKCIEMTAIKYTVIKNDHQYDEYCDILEEIVFSKGRKPKAIRDEIELLTFLIEKYDDEHRNFPLLDPVELLSFLMAERNIKAVNLAEELGITKGYLSQILNYKKEISKDLVRKLARKFNRRQEAFNRPYSLAGKKKKRKAA